MVKGDYFNVAAGRYRVDIELAAVGGAANVEVWDATKNLLGGLRTVISDRKRTDVSMDVTVNQVVITP